MKAFGLTAVALLWTLAILAMPVAAAEKVEEIAASETETVEPAGEGGKMDAPMEEPVRKDAAFMTFGMIGGYCWWKPVWGKTTHQVSGGVDGTYHVDPGWQIGALAAVRLMERLWIAAQFIYGRYGAEGKDPVDSTYTVLAENSVDTYDADLLVRYHVTGRLHVYGGVRFLGYVRRFNDILSGPSSTPLRTGHSRHYSGGSKFGIGYVVPLYRVIAVRGDFSGGSLFGYERDGSEYYTSAMFCELLAGPQTRVPCLNVTINLDFYWRFIYYSYHTDDDYRGDGTDHLYGVRISALCSY